MSEGPDEHEKIGPGRPPKKHRWVKGGPSPNPRGRPRKRANEVLVDAKRIVRDELFEPIKLSQGDRQITLSRFEIGVKRLMNDFAQGDRYARRDALELVKVMGIDLGGASAGIEEALSPAHKAILEEYIKRYHGADGEARERVIAPDDLRDDDSKS